MGFLLVNDGSEDYTLEQMIKLHDKDNHFSYLNLSRNYGKEIAMMAGFDYVKGDAMIIMDVDMQHSIDFIPEVLKHWEEGYGDDIVNFLVQRTGLLPILMFFYEYKTY